ncbi:MerR family transcriptional regulator [bacterium]|jgi:hypothetical protein|nr:MerR family transcriptional regulator [bacterium]
MLHKLTDNIYLIMQDDEKLITVKEAAQLLKVNHVTLKRWERVGKISVTRDPITNCRYYSFDDLMKIKEELIDEPTSAPID